MKRIDIKVDYRCNNNCIFCVIGEEGRKAKGVTVSEIKKELDFARQSGATEVAFTGGEPTIRKEIIELIKYAKNLDYKSIMLITNGRMLSKKEFARKSVNAGCNKFMFSIHGIGNNHDDLTRSPGSFKQAIQGMKNIKNLGQEMISDTVATKQNYKNLPEIIHTLINHGSQICQIDFVIPSGNALKFKEIVLPRLSECAPYVHKTIDYVTNKGKSQIIVMGIPNCFMKGYETYMNEPRVPSINIVSPQSVHAEVDYNTQRKSNKVRLDACCVCEHFIRCEGIWPNYLAQFGQGEFVPER
ncbi:MAG: radical SAM protein [Candidatus Woesearchaeota archaeon]